MKTMSLITCVLAMLFLPKVAKCEDRFKLPDSFAPSAEFRGIAGDGFQVSAWISEDGGIRVEVVLSKIRIKNSVKSGLPNETKVGDWKAAFVLVPMISAHDQQAIETVINAMPPTDEQKGQHSSANDLRAGIPELVGESYAFRILPSLQIPSDQAEIRKVEELIERILAKYEMRGKDLSADAISKRLLR